MRTPTGRLAQAVLSFMYHLEDDRVDASVREVERTALPALWSSCDRRMEGVTPDVGSALADAAVVIVASYWAVDISDFAQDGAGYCRMPESHFPCARPCLPNL